MFWTLTSLAEMREIMTLLLVSAVSALIELLLSFDKRLESIKASLKAQYTSIEATSKQRQR
jgi:hypothetical protein